MEKVITFTCDRSRMIRWSSKFNLAKTGYHFSRIVKFYPKKGQNESTLIINDFFFQIKFKNDHSIKTDQIH